MREVQAPCFSACSVRLFEEYPLLLFGVRVNYLMASENLPSECLSEHGGIRILDLFFLISLCFSRRCPERARSWLGAA